MVITYLRNMIIRNAEDKILETLSFFPVVGIVGPRQVGKTTLARKLQDKIEKESIYIDLENPRDLVRLSDPVLFFESHIDKCIIIDEVQLMPELFAILRPMVDIKREPGRFILLGSASPILIRKSSESLAGRIAYFELSGLNLSEVKEPNQKKLWIRGGFPDAFLAPNESLWKKWQENFLKTYIQRDLPMLGMNVNSIFLRNLWTMIAHSHGSVINYSNISKSLEMSSTSIKNYIDFFEHAFLVRQLQPYHHNIKKRVVKSPKIYIRDSGILHSVLNISSDFDLEGHPIKGNSWEGFVIENILQKAGSEYQAFFYRTHQGAELDLVLTKSLRPVYAIEVKYSSAPKMTKGNLISFEDIKADKNFIITPDTKNFLINKDTRVCNLADFLTQI